MRLRFAVVAAALVLTGCSPERPGLSTTGQAAPASTTTTRPVTLDAPAPYVPPADEVEPSLKGVAAATVQALMTYDPMGSSPEAARQRLAAAGALPEIADKAGSVLIPGAHSAADIVYPQLGGLTADRASVMVVVQQRLLQQGERQTVVRTLDVRAVRRDARWSVEDIASFGGEPVAQPAELSAAARQLLTHPSIQTPDSARWDILAGRISEPVIAVVLALAERHRLGITVFASGHPYEVFGTTRTSNHTRGAAVDLWLVDVPVVAQRDPRGPLPGLVSELLGRGVTELGAPLDVDGPSGANFTDTVHQDHLHLAFR